MRKGKRNEGRKSQMKGKEKGKSYALEERQREVEKEG